MAPSPTLPLLLLFAFSLALFLLPAQAQIYRGVATNEWTGGCDDLNALSRMSWWYNWALQPNENVANCALNPSNRYIEYVPMIWGKGSAEVIDLAQKIPPGSKYLLAFNEPNFNEQANLDPMEAASLWKTVIDKLDTAGLTETLKFGSPSASPGGNYDPVDWLKEFFGNCTGCRFDFIAMHNYDCNTPYYNGAATMANVNKFKVFDKPIWLTEFACPGNDINNELKYIEDVLSLLDADDQVERYSWFTARATNVGTAPSLFPVGSSVLTQVGEEYNSKGDSLPNPSDSSPSPSPGPGTSSDASALLPNLYLF